MTRKMWGALVGAAALLGVASLTPAHAGYVAEPEVVDGGELSAAQPTISWGASSEGISPDGLCGDVGGKSCYLYQLEVASDVGDKEIHMLVEPTVVGPTFSYDVNLHNSENPEDWEITYEADPQGTSRHPVNDYDIYLFHRGTTELVIQPDEANNVWGSYSAETGPVLDQIILGAGQLPAGSYDLVVLAKAAAPGSLFISEIRAVEPSCTITDENDCGVGGAH